MALLRSTSVLVLLLVGCAPTCPSLEKIDASASEAGLVQVLFSARCEAEPITDLVAENVSLEEDGEAVSGAEALWALEPVRAALNTYTLLLIDVSDSILVEGTLEAARAAATEFATGLVADGDEVQVALFDGAEEIRTLVEWSDDPAVLEQSIGTIGPEDQIDGSTNLNGAVIQGLDILDAKVEPEVDAELVSVANLVVFTDGVDRARRESDSAARDVVDGSDHGVFVVGLTGDAAVAEDLGALAKDGYFEAAATEALGEAFAELRATLVAETNRFYRVSYCSPLRGPRATLTIRVTAGEDDDTVKFSYPSRDFGPGCALPAP